MIVKLEILSLSKEPEPVKMVPLAPNDVFVAGVDGPLHALITKLPIRNAELPGWSKAKAIRK